MSGKVIVRFTDTSGKGKTEGRISASESKPVPRVSPPGLPAGAPLLPERLSWKQGFYLSVLRPDQVAAKEARIPFFIEQSGYTIGIIRDFQVPPHLGFSAEQLPNIFWYRQKEDGTWEGGLEWDLDDLRDGYHWERRHLRQRQLAEPFSVTIAGKTIKVKRPTRISVHDHHLPGLQHLAPLLELSDADYEVQAPLLRTSDSKTFKPSKAELRTIIDAERADHKLAHERSAATEAEIERLHTESTKAIDETDNDAVSNQRGFVNIFRAWDTEAYWSRAPLSAPEFEVIQTPPPPPPPTPAPVPDAPTGGAPEAPERPA